MSDPLWALSPAERRLLRLVTHGHGLEGREPMLATLTHERFSDERWLYERKLDGERCVAVRAGGRVDLFSRNGLSAASAYPELIDALTERATVDWVLDGEVVAFEHGRTSFARLQPRMHVSSPEQARRTGVTVYFYLFDVQAIGDHDVTALPLRRRKTLLRSPAHLERSAASDRVPLPRRRDLLPPCLRTRMGGTDRQARRFPLPARPLPRLAQVQV
ncbi:RNA ligase family protein [Streptomyces sp. 11-1-2]|uniref:ATP-dependent DNA ligase n=1 Tax=unclassified Streptomyces TaxID=2593676 RepID=UPI0023E29186|nr:RNA ligase family protein [Streptomyces sp. 11-1-2]